MQLFQKGKKSGGEVKTEIPVNIIMITQEEHLSPRRETLSAFIVRKYVI